MSTLHLENFRANFSAEVFRGMDSGERSLSEIARRAETSRAYIHRFINGEVDPRLSTCERLAAAVDMSFTKLIKNPR